MITGTDHLPMMKESVRETGSPREKGNLYYANLLLLVKRAEQRWLAWVSPHKPSSSSESIGCELSALSRS